MIEHFEAIHYTCEAEGKLKVKENTADKATNTTTTIQTPPQASTSSSHQFTDTDMGHSLGYLFHILQAHCSCSQQPTPPDQWDISMGMPTFVDDSNNNNDDDDNNKDNDSDKENWLQPSSKWLQPPHTPLYGNNMHPPVWPLHSGKHPGHSWEVNSWGTTYYYRLLICNPVTVCKSNTVTIGGEKRMYTRVLRLETIYYKI
jgi:hypothetical protein